MSLKKVTETVDGLILWCQRVLCEQHTLRAGEFLGSSTGVDLAPDEAGGAEGLAGPTDTNLAF
jgi:hypothetical protein